MIFLWICRKFLLWRVFVKDNLNIIYLLINFRRVGKGVHSLLCVCFRSQVYTHLPGTLTIVCIEYVIIVIIIINNKYKNTYTNIHSLILRSWMVRLYLSWPSHLKISRWNNQHFLHIMVLKTFWRFWHFDMHSPDMILGMTLLRRKWHFSKYFLHQNSKMHTEMEACKKISQVFLDFYHIFLICVHQVSKLFYHMMEQDQNMFGRNMKMSFFIPEL